jgi:hypothetical protein
MNMRHYYIGACPPCPQRSFRMLILIQACTRPTFRNTSYRTQPLHRSRRTICESLFRLKSILMTRHNISRAGVPTNIEFDYMSTAIAISCIERRCCSGDNVALVEYSSSYLQTNWNEGHSAHFKRYDVRVVQAHICPQSPI